MNQFNINNISKQITHSVYVTYWHASHTVYGDTLMGSASRVAGATVLYLSPCLCYTSHFHVSWFMCHQMMLWKIGCMAKLDNLNNFSNTHVPRSSDFFLRFFGVSHTVAVFACRHGNGLEMVTHFGGLWTFSNVGMAWLCKRFFKSFRNITVSKCSEQTVQFLLRYSGVFEIRSSRRKLILHRLALSTQNWNKY